MKLYAINTGNFMLDGGAMFGVVPKSIWQKVYPADDNNMCNWAMRCMLIETENKLILIDTGIGNKQSDKFFGHYYLNSEATLTTSLAKFGFNKSDITDVVLTHLHFDHCGGAVEKQGDELVTTFSNATYWCSETQWQWATQPNAREKASFLSDNILPLQQNGQLQFIKTNDALIGDNLYPIPSNIISDLQFMVVNGHTRGMLLPLIKYNNKTIVFMADLLPSIAHIPLPYVMAYDMFPLTSLNEKAAFLQQAALNNYILFFEHDLSNECCNLKVTNKGIIANETFTLNSIL